MTHSATFKIDEVDIRGGGTLSASIEIDYSFRLEPQDDGADRTPRIWIAICDLLVDEVRVNEFEFGVGDFERLVEWGPVRGLILDEIQATEISIET